MKTAKIDYGLIAIVMMLGLISIVAVYSATNSPYPPYYFALRQAIWFLLGSVVVIITLFFDYRKLIPSANYLYGFGLVLLVYVAFFGDENKGAQSWIDFPWFSFQPSEPMKILLIISIAALLTKIQESSEALTFLNETKLVLKVFALFCLPFLLIILQPDLGTALVFVGITAFMLLLSGVSWRMLLLLLLIVMLLLASIILLYFLNFELFSQMIKEHQLNRIYSWLDPAAYPTDLSYQYNQGLLAIGSGELLGKGLNDGSQSQGGWIPEVHTDFIFSLIAEEFGFLGVSILISLYFILIYRLVQIALTCKDVFGSYLVGGISGMFVFQIFQNIGMSIGILPISGLALPFISYGGSGLMTYLLAIGFVLNVSMRRKNYMFD
jgi:rod shape determining protein RodA